MPKVKESPSVVKEEKRKTPTKNLLLASGVIVLIVLLIFACVYFFLQYQKTQSLLKNPSASGQQEIAILLSKVGRHYDLPTNDQVTVATVSDVTKLQGQTFFAKAQNGDKVLIYPKTGTAILYRPTSDKIINVGPVNTQGDTTSQATPSGTQATIPLKVALYNGTQTIGLTTKVATALAAFSSVKTTVIAKANASNNYSDSVVVDLTGKNAKTASQLATFAKGKIAPLPSGETKPEGADILIILGTSYVGVTPTATPTP